jgi:PAS domain S-box-containing protein
MTAGVEPALPEDALLEAAAWQAIAASTFLCCIATDEAGAIRVLNAGAERMLGYAAAGVRGMKLTALCAQQELIARAAVLSKESGERVPPGFEALVRNASRDAQEDVFALTYLRKDGSRLPAMVSVSALRGERGAIIGYLLMGTGESARRLAEAAGPR